LPAGYRGEAQKTTAIRQFQDPVTRVTPVTHDLSNGGADGRTAPADDPVAIMPDEADPPTAANAIQGLLDAEWVEAMADALAANPYTITNRDTAMPYFRGRALAMLAATPDPYARGLLLGFERHRHVLAAPPQVHRDDHRRDQTPNRQNPLTAERTPQ
jgi:hypothetical protein